jgi:hypothetical protein
MKIVSFPHYTCGGLLCDILNGTYSPVGNNGGISSIAHQLGKIGDSDAVYNRFDKQKLLEILKNVDPNVWIGTHCWLGDIDIGSDTQVINVTTMTYRSRLYRWTRAWYHYYLDSRLWQNLAGLEEIDKQRETAKNYLSAFEPVYKKNFINIEFADIVERCPAFESLTTNPIDHHMIRWKQINHFLYNNDVWVSAPAQRFHEAEHEVQTKQLYIYE